MAAARARPGARRKRRGAAWRSIGAHGKAMLQARGRQVGATLHAGARASRRHRRTRRDGQIEAGLHWRCRGGQRPLGNGTAIHRHGFASGARPRKLLRARQTHAPEFGATRIVLPQCLDLIGPDIGIKRWYIDRRVAADLGQARRRCGQAGRAAGHRFKQWQAKAFVKGRIDIDAAGVIEPAQIVLTHAAREQHMVGQLQIAHRRKDRFITPAAPPDNHQPIARVGPPVEADAQRL